MNLLIASKNLRYNLPHTINNTPKQIINIIKTHSLQTVENNLKEDHISIIKQTVKLLTIIWVAKNKLVKSNLFLYGNLSLNI